MLSVLRVEPRVEECAQPLDHFSTGLDSRKERTGSGRVYWDRKQKPSEKDFRWQELQKLKEVCVERGKADSWIPSPLEVQMVESSTNIKKTFACEEDHRCYQWDHIQQTSLRVYAANIYTVTPTNKKSRRPTRIARDAIQILPQTPGSPIKWKKTTKEGSSDGHLQTSVNCSTRWKRPPRPDSMTISPTYATMSKS